MANGTDDNILVMFQQNLIMKANVCALKSDLTETAAHHSPPQCLMGVKAAAHLDIAQLMQQIICLSVQDCA